MLFGGRIAPGYRRQNQVVHCFGRPQPSRMERKILGNGDSPHQSPDEARWQNRHLPRGR